MIPSRRHKDYKHICTQHRSTEIYKEILEGLQGRYTQQHNYTRGFNTTLSKLDRSSKENINKDIVELHDTLDQMDLTDMCIEPLIQRSKIHILFKWAWNNFKDRPHDRTQRKPQQV